MNYLSPPRRLSQQREDVKAGRFDSYLRPIVYMFICTIIKTEKDLIFLFKTLILIAMFICTYDVIYMLGKLSVIPQVMPEIEGSVTIISSEFLSIRVPNLTALIFLTSFIFTLFFYKNTYFHEYKTIITLLLAVAA